MSNSMSGVFGVVSDVTPAEKKSPTKVRMVNEPKRSDKAEDKLWVNAVFWDKKQGEVVEKHFKKGNRVFIEGCLEPNVYKDKTYLNLNVSRFDFIYSGGGGGDTEQSASPKTNQPTATEDDIPF